MGSKKTLIKILPIIPLILWISSCNNCNKQSAINEFKTDAWWGLLRPDTIWFPTENEMNIKSAESVSKEYSCDFIAYGKKSGTYSGFKLKTTIKCTPYGWLGVKDEFCLKNSFGWRISDSILIKKLNNTPPSQFIPIKRDWEK